MVNFNKKIKRMDIFDIGLIKLSVAFFVLFLLAAWPAFADWAINTHWAFFIAIALVLGLRPMYRFFK
jgi:hypothetical protein